jgi:predicted alpha/beta superfamily hydrolase
MESSIASRSPTFPQADGMDRMRIVKFLTLSLAALLTPVSTSAQTPVPAVAEIPITTGTMHFVPSTVLGDHREINVWVPPAYPGGKDRYKVLYLLDGGILQDFQHIAGLAQLGALSWTYEPLIVVGIQTVARRAELTSVPADARYQAAFPESGGSERFRKYLRDEVIPFVEARYRTADRRALIGESLAGYFVVDSFLKAPDLFDDYIAISPSLWWDDRAEARRAQAWLAKHTPSDRRLYLAMADEGGTMKDGMNMLVRALDARDPQGLRWQFQDKAATETHSTIYHGAALDALRWLYAVPPGETGAAPWYMVEGGRPASK